MASKSRVCGVVVTGPLAAFQDLYRLALLEKGYSPLTVVQQLRQVARLSRWLEVNGVTVAELNPVRVEEFLVAQRAGGSDRGSWSRPALLCLLELPEGLVVCTVVEGSSPGSPMECLLAAFEHYLVAERGLMAGTIRGYVDHARRFVDGFPAAGLAEMSAGDVTAAVLGVSSSRSVSGTQNFVAGLKSFLRFCFVEGIVDVDLSTAALAITGRRRSLLPRGIDRADADALLGSCDRRSGLGRRDYAVIIILLRLGLRRAEVAGLCLDDIDWRAGEVVVRGKGARQDRLPLPVEVGEAIASYLRRGRPRTDLREVFLRDRAPFTPIAPGTVASTVRRACRRAGIVEVGSHRLRHTMACEMVAAEVPLIEIAQVLRHSSLQSTAVYARVDLDRLRLLAAPWPGSAQR